MKARSDTLPRLGTTILLVLSLGCGGVGAETADPAAPAPRVADHGTAPGVPPAADGAKLRGVSWVGGREPVVAADLAPLPGLGVDWIVQTPFGWQESPTSPHVHLNTGDRVWWGERDDGLRVTTRLARGVGVETLLKPHIWVRGMGNGTWRGEIAMADEAAWRAWFASYEAFLLHYARLAAELEIPILCIGTELLGTLGHEAEWRALVAKVRAVYPGRLTYAANWWEEVEAVRFWDALDFIGVQAYYPLSDGPDPTVEQMVAGWQAPLAGLEALGRRWDRPVLFTEVGYRSTEDAAARPWEWPGRTGPPATPAGLAVQARAYEAFFQAAWPRPWVAGAFFWKWFPKGVGDHPGERAGRGFTPQGKPALEVLRRGYGGRG